MGIGLLSFVILVAIVLHRKLCDATPVLTLTPETYKFKPEDNLVLSCSVNESVDLFSVSFYQNMIETIWINNSTSCSFFNLIPNDKRNYSIICDPSNTKFTMIKYGLNVSDDKAVWFCRMISKAGGSCPVANNPCTSGSSRLMLHDENTSGGPGNSTQWWCKCDWCIGLSVASGGLLVFSLVIGIIIFSKKRKEIENHMCWQRLTITIAVVVVIIIVVTGVFAGIVCRCWKEKK